MKQKEGSGVSGPEARRQANMREITVEAGMDQLEGVTDIVNAWLVELGCSEQARIQLDVAVDEIFGNIARYAYGDGGGTATLQMCTEDDPRTVRLVFSDEGTPFNPLEKEMPDTTGMRARERPIGGLGLFIVKRTMDDISYQYLDGKNILTIRKRIC